jgi:truncated hemoglobin YjbI
VLFDGVSRTGYERALARYLCLLLDGDAERWDGRDLRGVHADLAIDDEGFARFLDCLSATLDAAGVSARLAADVRASVASLRSLIIL